MVALENLPDGWWSQPSSHYPLALCFQRHIVNLQVVFRQVGGKTHQWIATGFIVEYESRLYWVTAGHVILDIQKLLADKSIQIGGASFIDRYPGSSKAIRISLEEVQLEGIDEGHFDIGFIPLRPMYEQLLRANTNLVPLTPLVWRGNNLASPEGFVVVGTPQSWNEFSELASGPNQTYCQASIPTVCAAVDRIGDRGANESIDGFWGHPDAFYGIIGDVRDAEGRSLNDIRGMSGAPIFSLERTAEGKIKYHLFGVQSSWLKEERIIRATPVLVLEAALNVYLDRENEIK